ncbi:S8 family peptidase [Lachnospiraceae bacterium LCP25S3_G4]
MSNPIIDENYLDLLVEKELLSYYPQQLTTYINNKVSMVHIEIKEFNPCLLGEYPYHVFPSCFTVEAYLDLEKSGVTRIQRNPNLALYGQDVLIGIVDTGIEYTHEAFRYEDGTTKIAAIWDQTIVDNARMPVGFGYGAEYKKDDIDLALLSENPLQIVPTTDEYGHGTILAGVAAGKQVSSAKFSGVAPLAELIIVKCKPAKIYNRRMFMIEDDAICYQETDLMLGIRYLVDTAERLGKPISICLGIGTAQGGHDGQGALSVYLSSISRNSRKSVTLSAGNEGNRRRHYYGTFTNREPYKDVELKIGKNEKGLSAEIWQYSPQRLAIDILSPTGQRSEIVYPQISNCRKFEYIFENLTLWVNNNIIEIETGDQVIVIRFQNPLEGIWKFRVYNMDNASFSFHAWLPSGGFISDETHFIESNPFTTLTSPGNAYTPITATAYSSVDESIFINASRGYTRGGVISPDIAAPGVDVTCPALGNSFASATGTGVASAFTAGVAAMLLEWAIVKGNYPTMTGNDIRKIMIRGAETDPNQIYPNETWGFGRLNIYRIFEKLQ